MHHLYAFSIRTSKVFMRPNVGFSERLQPQNVIIYLFSMKYSYLLTMKTTSDVNNSL